MVTNKTSPEELEARAYVLARTQLRQALHVYKNRKRRLHELINMYNYAFYALARYRHKQPLLWNLIVVLGHDILRLYKSERKLTYRVAYKRGLLSEKAAKRYERSCRMRYQEVKGVWMRWDTVTIDGTPYPCTREAGYIEVKAPYYARQLLLPLAVNPDDYAGYKRGDKFIRVVSKNDAIQFFTRDTDDIVEFFLRKLSLMDLRGFECLEPNECLSD